MASSAPRIHPTAVIHPEAKLPDDIAIGPYAVVGAGVTLGRRTRILAHVVVEGPTEIGEDNVLCPFAAIGGSAQDKRHQDGRGKLVIGSHNVFREHVTVHRGTGGRSTVIGDHGLFMVASHLAHDVAVGSSVTLANGVQLAGHAVVEDHVTFGGMSGLAQFVRVGESAFVAAGAMCERDVPPFVVVQGDRARVRALNKVGLRRRGIDEPSIVRLEKAFRALFFGTRPRAQVLVEIDASDPLVARLLAALSPTEGRPSR